MNQEVELVGRTRAASFRERTYEYIKDAIISNKLRPGTPLSEYWVAETLGVSRTPVREALGKLELEGFVVSLPGKGSVVSGVTAEWVLEIFEYREAVEGLACRLAASRMNAKARSELERKFLVGAPPTDLAVFNETGSSLHGAVRDFCENSMLQNSLETVRGHITRLRLLAAEIPGRAEQSFIEHRAIVQALAKGDEEDSERAMRKHIVSTKKSLFESLFESRLGRLPEGK